MGIGQEAGIEDQIRIQRHSILEAKTQARNQHGSCFGVDVSKARLDERARNSCTLKFEVSINVSATLRIGSSNWHFSTTERHTVSDRPSGCGLRVSEKRLDQHSVLCVEKNYPRRKQLSNALEYLGQLIER